MFQKNSNEALSTSTKICNVFIVNRIYLKLQKMVCQLPYRQVCFIRSYCWGWTNGLTLRILFTDEGFWHWGHVSLMKVFDIEDTFHWWRFLTLRILFTDEGFWHWGRFSPMKVFDIEDTFHRWKFLTFASTAILKRTQVNLISSRFRPECFSWSYI